MEKALILAEGAYNTLDGKTAHGLVRYSRRFEICGVIDSTIAGKDAGEVLNGTKCEIPIYASLEESLEKHHDISFLIIGVATEGGYMPEGYKNIVKQAITQGIHILNGLHQFLTDDFELLGLSRQYNVELIDVRKIFNTCRIFYTGKIHEVLSRKVAVLGTDSIVGKRTTAIMLHQAFEKLGKKSAFVALGQTGWMQGFKHSIVMDAIINDFVAGAIEDVIWRAWKEKNPEIIVTHGEGAFFHPAYPGGFELLAAGKPDYIILQHAPARKYFDSSPKDEIPPLDKNIQIIELLSGNPPFAMTIYSEGLSEKNALEKAREIESIYGILTRVPAYQGVDDIATAILEHSILDIQPQEFLMGDKMQKEYHIQNADELNTEQLEHVAGGTQASCVRNHDRSQSE